MWPFTNTTDPQILIKELENPDPTMREKAFKGLKNHEAPETDRLILAAIEAYDQIDREIILPLIDIAGHREIEEVVPVFASLLKSKDFQIREAVVQALSLITTQESLDVLVSLLADNDPAMKSMARIVLVPF
jgi:HEAT repeat protein